MRHRRVKVSHRPDKLWIDTDINKKLTLWEGPT